MSVFKYLNRAELLTCMTVCKAWYKWYVDAAAVPLLVNEPVLLIGLTMCCLPRPPCPVQELRQAPLEPHRREQVQPALEPGPGRHHQAPADFLGPVLDPAGQETTQLSAHQAPRYSICARNTSRTMKTQRQQRSYVSCPLFCLPHRPGLRELRVTGLSWSCLSALVSPTLPCLRLLDLRWCEGIKDAQIKEIVCPPGESLAL